MYKSFSHAFLALQYTPSFLFTVNILQNKYMGKEQKLV